MHSPIKRNVLQHKINTQKKLQPGLVASYDIWPGNGEGLFLFWHFINLSLTYLRHLPTYLQPENPHRALRSKYADAYTVHMYKCSQLPYSTLTTCTTGRVLCMYTSSVGRRCKWLAKPDTTLEMWANAQRDGRPAEYR